MELINLSIVLLVRSNVERLSSAVAECLALAATQPDGVEIIIVDDGGDHQVARMADQLAATHSSVAVIHFRRRMGYRYALNHAWSVAGGHYLLALNLSGPASASDIPRLLGAADGHAVILGYRTPRQRGLRELISALTVWRKAPDLRDPSLGLALFRADQRHLLTLHGMEQCTHADIYAAAHLRGERVAQVAVRSQSQRRSTTASDGIVGLGLLIAAGGLWILRRLRRSS